MLHARYLSLALLAWMGPTPGFSQSPAPVTIGFSGSIRSASGAPVEGCRSVTFSLYAEASGGAPLWSETQAVSVSGGVFHTALGTTTPFPPRVDFTQAYYVGVSVESGDELAPRLALQSVPYANLAHTVADQCITADKLASGAVTGDKLDAGFKATLVTQAVAPLVANGGFEFWKSGSVSPDAWSVSPTPGTSVARATESDAGVGAAYEGACVRISTITPHNALWQRAFAAALQPSTQYTISWKRKVVAFSGAPKLMPVYISACSAAKCPPVITVSSVDADWVSESYTFTTGATPSSFGYDGLYLGYNWPGGSGGYTVLYDDVVCVPGASVGHYAGSATYAMLADGSLAQSGSAGQILISDGTAFRSSNPTSVVLSLPPMIYAVEGHETNVYFDDIARADIPTDELRFDVTCAKGTQQSERWTYVPGSADAGSVSLRVDAYWQNVLVATKTTNLVTSTAAAGAGVERKALAIGDSTTAGGQWLSELVNLFNCNHTSPVAGGGADPMALRLVGSLSATANDAGGTVRTVPHDAIAGWRTSMFVTNDGAEGRTPCSPFVGGVGQAFDFGAFLTAHSITMAADDWVIIHLGINDVFGATSDSAAAVSIATMQASLAQMLSSIRAAAPGVRIGIMLPIPPSASQDAFGANYGSGQTRWRYRRNRDLAVESLISAYSATPDVTLIATNGCLDAVHNMILAEAAPVNSRSATKAVRQSNGVHPANPGYWQMADVVYAALKGAEG